MKQRSPEWFAARCGCIGASSIADVLATVRSGEAASRANLRTRLVVERITGRPVETFQSQAMLDGIEREPNARAAYEAETGNLVQEVGWIPHPEIAGAGCSPDGLVGEDGLLEIKCPGLTAHLETIRAKAPPAKYLPQLQWQMAVTGRQWNDYASYHPDYPEHLRLAVYRVERDDEMIAHMEAEVRKLLAEVEEIVRELEAAE